MIEKAQGCLVGLFCGDALGSSVEFMTEREIKSNHPNGVREMEGGGPFERLLQEGQITDDGEMAIALARSIVEANKAGPGVGYSPDMARNHYLRWRDTSPFGMGRTTRKALGGTPQPESQANGALMRCAPLGIFCAPQPQWIMSWAENDACITHVNPVCVRANQLFVGALAVAIRHDATPEKIHKAVKVAAEMIDAPVKLREVLDKASHEPPLDYQENMGWVVTAFHNAFFQLLNAPSLEEGLVDTVRRGGDTDTNAAIAGAFSSTALCCFTPTVR